MRSRESRLRTAAAAALFGLVALATALSQPRAEGAPAERADDTGQGGLVVVAVDLGGPADAAGVHRGDILLKADKIELSSASDLTGYVSRLKSGDSITLELRRGDSTMTLDVNLGDRAGRPYLGVSAQGAQDQGVGGGLRLPDLLPTVPWQSPRLAPNPYASGTRVEARIVEVVASSPAAKAGIAIGDDILSVDGVDLTVGGSLLAEVAKRSPGDRVTLRLRHADGGTENVEVTLEAAAGDATKAYLGVRYQEMPIVAEVNPDGFRIVPFGDRRGSMSSGLLVRDVASGSPAEKAGIRSGDIITSIGGDEVTMMTPIADLVGRHKPGDTVDVTFISRGDEVERTVAVTLGSREDDQERAYLGVTTGGRLWIVPNDGRPRGRLELRQQQGGRSDI